MDNLEEIRKIRIQKLENLKKAIKDKKEE